MFDLTVQDICTPGYSKKVRAVTAKLKRQAYAQYGITSWEPGDYEVDHLIPLSLGASNSIRNLWPQSYRTSPWNAHVKNVLERRLHNMVCAGKVDLQTAQHEIATDWIKAYQKYIAKSPPASEVHEPQFAPETATGDEVWVNTRSGKRSLRILAKHRPVFPRDENRAKERKRASLCEVANAVLL